MNRWVLSLLVLAFVQSALRVEAAPPAPTGPPSHRLQTRYKIGSFGAWVRTDAPGYPAYRYTYNGQRQGFPLPAIYQYGMEHNNLTYGPGF